jgi:hypothetical protein
MKAIHIVTYVTYVTCGCANMEFPDRRTILVQLEQQFMWRCRLSNKPKPPTTMQHMHGDLLYHSQCQQYPSPSSHILWMQSLSDLQSTARRPHTDTPDGMLTSNLDVTKALMLSNSTLTAIGNHWPISSPPPLIMNTVATQVSWNFLQSPTGIIICIILAVFVATLIYYIQNSVIQWFITSWHWPQLPDAILLLPIPPHQVPLPPPRVYWNWRSNTLSCPDQSFWID